MTRKILTAAAALMAAASFGETVIEGDWTVVYPEYPKESCGLTQGLSEMANVLCDTLGESVGVKAKAVVEGREPKGPGRRFFMGGKFAEVAGLMPADFKGYDWGIAEKDGDIYFFGHDRTGSIPSYKMRCVIPSALAASKFMCRQMGVLFLMPGRIGREVPKLKRLAVPEGFFERGTITSPIQGGRSFDYAYNMANCIYGSGAAHSYGGHTYSPACPVEKYRDTHPEYFAKDEKGKPIWAATSGCQAYCISNPDFQRLVYEEMLRRYDAGAEICQLGQNDGPAGVCRCEGCRNLYGISSREDGERTVYGASGEWCEKLWLFHKEIAERLMKDRPGKLVHMMCYGDTANPPKSFKVFPPNVMIEVCSYGESDMKKWDGYTVPQGFTYYIYNWSWYPILGFTPKRSVAGLVDQVQRFHRYGMKGIYRCGYGEMFGMEGPAYWVYNKLVEDPAVNVLGALAQYYKGAFGPAAEPMKRFYEDLEAPLSEVEKLNSTKASDLVESTIKRSKKRGPIVALSMVYTPERVARMDAALKEAEQTQGLSEKQVRRLELVRTEWNYVRNVGSIAYMYREYRDNPTKDGCRRILAAVRERNAMIEELFPNGKMRKVKGWPEIRLFGEPPIDQFKVNGRLGAPIGAPLIWPVDEIERSGILPGVENKAAEAICTEAAPAFSEFESADGWNELGGISMERVPVKAKFKAMHDDANLYVLVEGDLADNAKVKSFVRDGSVWGDDCVDLIIAPGASRKQRYHFIFGPEGSSCYDSKLGFISDPKNAKYGKDDPSWNGDGWKTESRRGGGRWRAIATIPYADLGVAVPKSGDRWFFNVGRTAKLGEKRNQGCLMLWSPNMDARNMSTPEAMGTLVFK